MIDEFEAEVAIREVADRLPEEDELMIGTMVDVNAYAPDAYVERHAEWREAGGVPHFRATIHYTNDLHEPMIGGDYIELRVRGTFKQSRAGLKVNSYSVQFCEVMDSHNPRPVEL